MKPVAWYSVKKKNDLFHFHVMREAGELFAFM